MTSWICVCVAIYALNGISDVEGDRHNHSSRPIASGALPIAAAWQAIVWLLLVGLVAAALVSTYLVVAFVAMFAVGWAYSFGARPLKNSLPGLVASGTSLGLLTYLAGWLSARGDVLSTELVVLAVGMSLWMGLVGSATKDLKDLSGDLLAGRRTLPILLGPRRAARLAGVVAGGYALAFFTVSRSVTPALLLPAVCVLAGGVAVVAITWLTCPAPTGRAYRTYMVTQYVANLSLLA